VRGARWQAGFAPARAGNWRWSQDLTAEEEEEEEEDGDDVQRAMSRGLGPHQPLYIPSATRFTFQALAALHAKRLPLYMRSAAWLMARARARGGVCSRTGQLAIVLNKVDLAAGDTAAHAAIAERLRPELAAALHRAPQDLSVPSPATPPTLAPVHGSHHRISHGSHRCDPGPCRAGASGAALQ
jgi:hypothetical protein